MSDKDIKARIQKEPWLRKPLELLFHAEIHYGVGKDYDKRISYIGFDNSIEISILTYVKWDPESKKEYKGRLIGKRTEFDEKLKVLKKIVENDKKSVMLYNMEAINHYHEQRNDFYHTDKFFSPDSGDLDQIRKIAMWVFKVLFDQTIEYDLNELVASSEKTFPSIPEGYAKPEVVEINQEHKTSFLIATILGRWNEKYQGDNDIIRRLLSGF